MELFKKKKITETKKDYLDEKSIKEFEEIENSGHLLEERIHIMEKQLTKERDALSSKFKEKEEKSESLKAQLERIIYKSEYERKRRESKLNALQRQIKNEASELEKMVEDGVSKWEEKLKGKEAEINAIRQEGSYKEEQKRLESEQNIGELESYYESLSKKLKVLESRISEEQENWSKRIKGKEEELINFQSKLSLRETQNKNDEESYKVIECELKESWQEKASVLGQKFESEKEEHLKIYNSKEEELARLKSELNKHLNSIEFETEGKTNEIKSLCARTEDKISIIESSFETERRNWIEALKKREEELNALKISLMLIESQEKAQKEKRVKGLEEEEKYIGIKINSIKERISHDRLKWEKLLKDKDEELNLAKINSNLKLSEMKEAWESKKASAETEKINLIGLLQEISLKFDKEKANRQKELEGKDSEILIFKKEWEEKRKESALKEESIFEEIVQNKNNLKTEFKSVGEIYEAEKSKWVELIKEKALELKEIRAELDKSESSLKGSLDKASFELEEELSPLRKKLNETESKISRLEHKSKLEVDALNAKKSELESKYSKAIEDIKSAFDFKKEKIEREKEAVSESIERVKDKIERYTKQSEDRLLVLNQEKELIESKLLSETARFNEEKENIRKAHQKEKKSLEAEITRLESVYAGAEAKYSVEVKNAESGLESVQKSGEALIAEHKKEIESKESELENNRLDYEKQLGVIYSSLNDLKQDYSSKIQHSADAIKLVKEKHLNVQSEFQSDISSINEVFEREMVPLKEKRSEIEALIEASRAGHSAKTEEIQRKMLFLKSESERKHQEYENNIENIKVKISQARKDFEKVKENLQKELKSEEALYTQRLSEKEIQIESLVREFESRKKEYESRKNHQIKTNEKVISNVKSEILKLNAEKHQISQELPEILSHKQSELSSLEAQINERLENYNLQLSQAETSLESFQKRIQKRIENASIQLNNLKEKSARDLNILNNKYADLKSSFEREEKQKQNELSVSESVFSEEKVKLLSEKEKLEKELIDLRNHSQNEITKKENEILSIKSELSEKESLWQREWKKQEAQHNQEKTLLISEYETLSTSIKGEQELFERQSKERHGEIEYLENNHTERMKTLEADIFDKKNYWELTLKSMGQDAENLKLNLDTLELRWNETKTKKEKELSVLKSNIEFWQLKTKTEEEKRIAQWEDEKQELESNIANASLKLKNLQNEITKKLEEKETEIKVLRRKYHNMEQDSLSDSNRMEAEFLKKRQECVSEIESWEKRVKDETSASEREQREIERNIERLKLDSALQDTRHQAEKNRGEREWVKLRRRLKDEVESLIRKLGEEKESWIGKIHFKDEEIKTLHVRLNLREERRQLEIRKRKQDIGKILSELENGIETIKNRKDIDIPLKNKEIKHLREVLSELKQGVENREGAWKEEQDRKKNISSVIYNEVSSELLRIESEIKKESERLRSLMDIKEKQIKNLTSHMMEKEEELVSEREHTQELIGYLKDKEKIFKDAYNKMCSAEKGKVKKAQTKSKFDLALELIDKNDYTGAKAGLEEIIKEHPMYSGAYQYMALCCFNLNDIKNAHIYAGKALELSPENEELKKWAENLNQKLKIKDSAP